MVHMQQCNAQLAVFEKGDLNAGGPRKDWIAKNLDTNSGDMPLENLELEEWDG